MLRHAGKREDGIYKSLADYECLFRKDEPICGCFCGYGWSRADYLQKKLINEGDTYKAMLYNRLQTVWQRLQPNTCTRRCERRIGGMRQMNH